MAAFDFPTFPELDSPRFLLRQITPGDHPAIFLGLSDPQVIAHYGVSYSSLEDAQRQMDWFQNIYADGSGIWWGICQAEQRSTLLGAVGLNEISSIHRRGEIGYWLMPEHWGRGIARECVSTVLSFAFGPLGLHRIGAEVDTDNHRSSALLEGLGFQLEGIRRGYELKAGKHLDLKCYSLLATDVEARG